MTWARARPEFVRLGEVVEMQEAKPTPPFQNTQRNRHRAAAAAAAAKA